MIKRILVLLFAIFVVSISDAYADSDIFTSLAEKASTIGKGLRSSGYMIAGIGLIVFSFMAIFNKISWKNLAYIMLSCFLLSVMFGVVNYISGGKSGVSDLTYDSSSSSSTPSDPGNAKDVPADKNS